VSLVSSFVDKEAEVELSALLQNKKLIAIKPGITISIIFFIMIKKFEVVTRI
jgi:hypothetical protein